MHVDGDSQHRCQCYQLAPNVAVTEGTMVRPLIIHHAVDVAEGSSTGEIWDEPGRRPSWVGALVENVMYFLWKINCPALGDLQHRPKSFHNVDARRRDWHAATREETGGKPSTPEILGDGFIPGFLPICCRPVASSAAGPEFVKWRIPSAALPVSL